MHSSSGIRTHDPNVRAGEEGFCLRRRGHCDWHSYINITYLLTYLRSWALIEKLPIEQPLKNFPVIFEPEGSLPSSQEPSTGPYPKPDRYSP
jgi:hypothetical protein